MAVRHPTFMIAALILTSCDQVSGILATVRGEADVYPMAVGNVWRYEIFLDDVKQGTEVDEMISVTKSEGMSTAIVKVTQTILSTGQQRSVNQVLRKTSQDLTQGSENGVSAVVLKLPLETGKSWQLGSATMTVSGKEDLAVQAGSYGGCFKLSGQNGSTVVANWYAPGIGLVKSETRSGEQVLRQELTSVEIK